MFTGPVLGARNITGIEIPTGPKARDEAQRGVKEPCSPMLA